MTTSPGRRARITGIAALAAALAAPAGLPAQQPADDCAITTFADMPSTWMTRENLDSNFACLQSRIDALKSERDALAARLDQIEGTYLNVDGKVMPSERHFGPGTYVLTGDRRGRPRSLEIDRARVLEMCGDAEGCLVSLGLEGVLIGSQPVEAMFAGGPCVFHADAKEGDWALSGHCAAADLPSPSPGDAEEDAAEDAAEADGPAWGRDGDARPLGGATQAGRAILSFGGACLLAEALPETRPGAAGEAGFAQDTNPDLFLVTAGAEWAPAGPFPAELLPLGLSDPDFRCILIIRD